MGTHRKQRRRWYEEGAAWSWTVRNGARRQADRQKAATLRAQIAAELATPLNGGLEHEERAAIRAYVKDGLIRQQWSALNHGNRKRKPQA